MTTTNVSGEKLPRRFHIETADTPRPVSRPIDEGPPRALMTSPTVSRLSESLMDRTNTTLREVRNGVLPLLDVFPGDCDNSGMQTPLPHPTSRTEIAKRIMITRAAMDLDQVTFAKRCRLSQQQLSNYENLNPAKGRRPNLDEALKIVAGTGCGLDWIYRGETDRLPAHLIDKVIAFQGAPPKKLTDKIATLDAAPAPARKRRRKSS